MTAMRDDELSECIASGQWRCTVEEVQDTATRLLAEKRVFVQTLLAVEAFLRDARANVADNTSAEPRDPLADALFAAHIADVSAALATAGLTTQSAREAARTGP